MQSAYESTVVGSPKSSTGINAPAFQVHETSFLSTRVESLSRILALPVATGGTQSKRGLGVRGGGRVVVDVVLLLDVDVLVLELVLDEVEVVVTVLLVDVELLDEVDVLVLEVVTEDVELLVDVVFVEEVLVLTEVDVVVLELVL